MIRWVVLVFVELALVSGVDYGLSRKTLTDEELEELAAAEPEDSFAMFWTKMPDVQPIGHRSSTDPETLEKERQEAYGVYTESLGAVKENNNLYNLGQASYKMVINSFAVMTETNRRLYLGLNIVNRTVARIRRSFEDSCPHGLLPTVDGCADINEVHVNKDHKSSVDWKDSLPDVKNQEGCGSCWTFPAAALLEHAYKDCTGRTIALSEQELLDCSYPSNVDGCRGGFYVQAWKHVKDRRNHLSSAKEYAYRSTASSCQYQHYKNALEGKVSLDSWYHIAASSVISEMQLQPLAVAIYAADDYFLMGSGIYDSVCTGDVNHAVVLVGYGPGYWDTRNSWGPNWANRGYSKFERSGLKSTCSILDLAFGITWTDLDDSDKCNGNDCNDEGGDGDEKCEDKQISGCATWAARGYCVGEHEEYMSEWCAKTCEECGQEKVVEECEDKHQDCEHYRDNRGYCESGGWVSWMAENCKKACNKCDPVPTEDPTEEKFVEDCEDNSGYKNNCGGWVSLGYCDKTSEYRSFMANNCQKSCRECPNSDPSDEPTEEPEEEKEIQLDWQAVTQSSSKSDAENAVDNDESTKSVTNCNNRFGKKPAWFKFEIKANSNEEVKITRVEILGHHFSGKMTKSKARPLTKLDGAQVKVGSSVCGEIEANRKSGSKDDQSYTISCDGITGNTVKIEQTSKSFKKRNCLDINEIKVFGIISGESSSWGCSKTRTGGCVEWDTHRLQVHQDSDADDCQRRCDIHDECWSFNVVTSGYNMGECALFRAGCTAVENISKDWFDCSGGGSDKDDVDDKNAQCVAETGCKCGLKKCDDGTCKHEHMCY